MQKCKTARYLDIQQNIFNFYLKPGFNQEQRLADNQKQQFIKPRNYGWEEKINWKFNPQNGKLAQPQQLWSSMRKSWNKYKHEQEYKFKQYKQSQQNAFKQWKNHSDKLKKKLFRD